MRFKNLPAIAFLLSASLALATDYTGWSSKSIVINPAGLGLTAPVTNFPVLIRLSESAGNFIFSESLTPLSSWTPAPPTTTRITGTTGGGDVRFTAADGTTDLIYQIESWDATAKTAEVWVLVPTLSNTSPTTLKMYWGKTGQTTPPASHSGPTVFSRSNVSATGCEQNLACGFVTVNHISFPNITGAGSSATAEYSSTITDANVLSLADLFYMQNKSVPTTNNPVVAGGNLIGYAATFDGLTEGFSINKTKNDSATNFTRGDFTLSAWINQTGGAATARILSKTGQYHLGTNGSGQAEFEFDNNPKALTTAGACVPQVVTAGLSAGWNYVVAVHTSAGTMGISVNGSPLTLTAPVTGTPFKLNSGTQTVTVGYESGDGGITGSTGTTGPALYFQGSIDEPRIENVARGNDWITWSYATQKAAVTAVSFPAGGEDYTTWPSNKDINVNTSSSGANIPGNVTNFPLLVRLNSANFSAFGTPGSKASLRFARGSKHLAYQVEDWDSTGGQTANVWVKVDTVLGNTASQTLKMYWGKSGVADSSVGSAVFDTTNGFQGVWHLGESTGASALDATANGFSGTPATTGTGGNPLDTAGVVGRAKSFHATSFAGAAGTAGAYYAMAGTASGKLNFPEGGVYTVSAWARANDASNSGKVVSKGDQQYYIGKRSSGTQWEFMENKSATGQNRWRTPTSGTQQTWKHLVGVRYGSALGAAGGAFYIDGVLSTTFSTSGASATINSLVLNIGRDPGQASAGPDYYFGGGIDEVTIASVARDSNWVRLSFATQKPTATAVTVGAVAAPLIAYKRAVVSALRNLPILADSIVSTGGPITAFALSAGSSLPAGITLNSTTGEISGTPTALFATKSDTVVASGPGGSAAAIVTVTVTDTVPVISYKQSSILGKKNVAIAPDTVIAGGGSITGFALSAGSSLPAGVTLNAATGLISGTPTAVFASRMDTIVATGSGGTGMTLVTIAVTDTNPVVTYKQTAILAKKNVAIADTVVSTGGAVTSFALSAGSSLPTGITLNSVTGLISGTATVLFPLTSDTIVATGSGGAAMVVVTIVVTDSTPFITYKQPSISGTLGLPISPDSVLSIGGAVTTYTLTAGSALPAGITLNSATGVISGTPTALFATKTDTIVATGPGGVGKATVAITIADSVENYATWPSSKDITVNTSISGANIPGNVTNFPLLVRLNATNLSAFGTPGTKASLRFGRGAKRFAYQIEDWDSAGQTAAVWVKVDTVFGNAASQTFKMYWGKSGVADSSNGRAVFDTVEGFQAVWHLGEATNANTMDATANGFTGAPATTGTGGNPLDTSGVIGHAKSFHVTSFASNSGTAGAYYAMAGTANGKLNFPEGSAYTLSAWVRSYDANNSGKVISKGDQQYYLSKRSGGTVWEFMENKSATGQNRWRFPTAGTEFTWKHIVGVRTGSTLGAAGGVFYMDGVLSTDFSTSGASATINTNVVNLGRDPSQAGGAPNYYYTGAMDEVTVSSVARDSNWVRLSFQTQKPGASSVIVGTPPPPTLAILVNPQSKNTTIGSSVKFVVAASGVTPLIYSWVHTHGVVSDTLKRDTLSVSFDTLTIASVVAADTGLYKAVVRNISGTVVSDTARLRINAVPTIASQPANLTVNVNDKVKFGVVGAGTPPLTYQWIRINRNATIDTMTNASQFSDTLILSAIQLSADSTGYRCIVANGTGSVLSNMALLHVLSGTSIISSFMVRVGGATSAYIFRFPEGVSHMRMTIQDIRGHRVWSRDFEKTGEATTVSWNGKGSDGGQVASGMYLVHMKLLDADLKPVGEIRKPVRSLH